MAVSERIELKSAPEVKRLILAAFPSYKKHNAYLSAFHGGKNINSYWDGGSREEYRIVASLGNRAPRGLRWPRSGCASYKNLRATVATQWKF